MRISDWSSDVCSSDLLVYLQPHDYWHVVPDAPAGYWVEHFDVVVIRSADEAQQHLPKNASRCAILGEPQSALGQYGAFKPNNPPAAVDYLEYHRAYKPPYEIAMMREATRRGVRRSEEHTSELQSLMRISYAVYCLKKKTKHSLSMI